MIPYGRQNITKEDIQAVVEVLESDWLTTGPWVPRFEQAIATTVGVRHGIAMNSATSALHAACVALGLGPQDWLWTVPNTFVASANCALYCGARVDFVDIDPGTYNMSVESLGAKLKTAELNGRLPKVLVPVHFAGQPCDMPAIKSLADKYGVRVIEDASHAIGGSYASGAIGNCAYSDISIFSFHPVKIITTAEGGMALTNDDGLAAAMARFRTHGITRQATELNRHNEGSWYYEQQSLGFNYRITDVQCALGLSQLKRLSEYVDNRRSLANRYDRLLKDLPIILPFQDFRFKSAWHLYVVQVDQTRTRKTRKEVFDGLRSAGIGVNVHYIPVHLQPYYRKMGFEPGMFPEAEAYYSRAISLPMYATLKEEQQDFVFQSLKLVL